jgi:hypothetical protein
MTNNGFALIPKVLKFSKEEKKEFNILRGRLILNERSTFNRRIGTLLDLEDIRRFHPDIFYSGNSDIETLVKERPFKDSYNDSVESIVSLIMGDDEKFLGKKDIEILKNCVKVGLVYHGNTLRKGRQFFYFLHPIQVSRYAAVEKLGFSMVGAGILHDVAEEHFKMEKGRKSSVDDVMNIVKKELNPGRKENLEKVIDEIVGIATQTLA